MPRKSAAAKSTPPPADPALPEVLIPPSQAKHNEREAYWLELAEDPSRLKAAFESTEFWPMLQEFPPSFWGNHLSIYLYRLEDDAGLMVKNADGEGKYIKPIIRAPIDEEWVANRHGGGKYQAWLKWENKETLRKHTFRIDGPPKVQPGQIVEMDGKPVSIAAPASTNTNAAADRSDIATVIEAQSHAQQTAIDIVKEASSTAIALVKEQSKPPVAPPAAPGDSLTNRLLEAALTRMLAPQPDPIETFARLQGLIAKRSESEDAPEPKDPPLAQAMDLVERFTGKNFSDLINSKGARAQNPASESPFSWLTPLVPVLEKIVAAAPALMHEIRVNKDLEFQRAVFLRTMQPSNGTAQIPTNLLPARTAPPQPAAPVTITGDPQPQNGAAPAAPANAPDLMTAIVTMICHGFDRNPRMGYQCAAAIDSLYGDQIEAAGIEKALADTEKIEQFITVTPALKQRASDARWKVFMEDFLEYTAERWGDDEGDEDDPEPANSQPQSVA